MILSHKFQVLGVVNGNNVLVVGFASVLFVLLGASGLWADVTGSIQGYVKDSSGAMMASAHVVVTDVATSVVPRNQHRCSRGLHFSRFTPRQVQDRCYRHRIQQTTINDIDLNVNDQLRFDLTMGCRQRAAECIGRGQRGPESRPPAPNSAPPSSRLRFSPCRSMAVRILICSHCRRAFLPPIRIAATPIEDPLPVSIRPRKRLHGRSTGVGQRVPGEWRLRVNETKNMGAGLIPNADSIAECSSAH